MAGGEGNRRLGIALYIEEEDGAWLGGIHRHPLPNVHSQTSLPELGSAPEVALPESLQQT